MANSIGVLMDNLKNGSCDSLLSDLYMDESLVKLQKDRYISALTEFKNLYGEKEVEIYSAPGRSEIGGNHTDHQLGKVLATSVNIDTIAVVAKTDDDMIHWKSKGYKRIDLNLLKLEVREREYGTTTGLIRGVAAGVKEAGYKIGGFEAYSTSQVLSGSGLSSSAAFEVLVGNIFSGLYNIEKPNSVQIAKIGQMAENVYFGKPCGLMDQMACSYGGLIKIDFKDKKNPEVVKVDTDFKHYEHSLCIVDTKGSHADLTDEYAAIPQELKKVCEFFGKEVLREVDEDLFMQEIAQVRKAAGDRAVLRALHIFAENKRVDEQAACLAKGDFEGFKAAVNASGNSSYKYLQNVYSSKKPNEQSVSIGICVSEAILQDRGVVRVHGGGFAGTIQAFVPDDLVAEYKEKIEKVFGAGSCYVLKVRNVGGTKVM